MTEPVSKKNHVEGSREMAQPLEALADLVEGWSCAPSVQPLQLLGI